MAYGLKYTQYISKGGTTLRVNVYAKDWTGATYGMAHVLGASLQIVGGQADIISPIIKTSFSWSLADAWDQGTEQADGTTCVNVQGEKCGRWEEFHTKDATKFRVDVLNGSAVIWRGYVTPDSWAEEMQFHGSVTITARDMLGALQDVEFDLTGRVTVLDVVQGALEACSCPMELYYVPAHFLVNENGQSILAHDFAASTFSGRNWYQALEDTMDSLGLVLRYNGAGQIVLTSLRYLAADTLQGHHEVAYANRSGLRSMDPALKFITETFDVDFEESQAGDPETTQFSPTGENLTQKVVAKLDSGATVTNTHAIPAYNLTQEGGEGWSGTLAVPQIGTAVDGAPDRKIYFPTDIQESVEATWYGPRLRGAFSFRFAMDGSLLERATRSGQIILRPTYNQNRHFVDQITIRVEADVNGTVKYLSSTGSWETVSGTLNVEPGTDVVVPDAGGTGIRIVVLSIRTANTLPAYNALFAPINLITEPAEGSGVVREYKTTTNYDQENNVTITRSPVIGSADQEGCIDFFPNLLGYGDTVAPDKWNWPGEASFFHLAVMIQAQVLCYYAAAASVFAGTAVDRAADFALPGYAFDYYSRRGVPVSGVYDLASGFAVQSTVREVYSWEEVWGESFAPEYTQKSGSGKGSTSATGAGGASASGGSSGGGGGTSVNYFEPDGDYENGIKLRNSYDGLRLPGIRLGGGDAAFDLEVITVNGQRCLHSPLPILSDKDISGFYDGGSGGGTSDFDEAAMWAALGGTIGVNEVIDISHIPNLPTTKIYDLETWISGKGFLTQVPVASSSQLGGVKIGSGISIASDGTISAASSEELALAVAMNASRLDDLEAAFDAPVFGELYAETLRSRSASATELWIGAVRLWYQDGSVRVSGGVLADGDVSGFYDGGSGGGGGSFDESAMWQALGTDITTQVIDASHLPTSPVTSVVGLTGAISQADLRTALGLGSFAYISSLAFSGLSSHPTTLAGYGITDAAFGTPGTDYVPVTLGGTTKNVLTAHQSLAGYLTTTSAAATYETIANVDAVEQRLAAALGVAIARLDTLDDWTADVVPELQRYTDTVLGDVRQPLEVALACCASRLDALEYAFADGQFADLKVTTLGVDYLATRGNAWIGGSVCAAGDVGGFYGSDRALKDDIRDFSDKSAADILRRIRLVSFTWNARASQLNADNVGEDFGVIAQEVEAACPRMVRHGHYGEDLLGVDYAKRLPSVLLGGWHDHERRIAALERENKQLKEKLRQNGCI